MQPYVLKLTLDLLLWRRSNTGFLRMSRLLPPPNASNTLHSPLSTLHSRHVFLQQFNTKIAKEEETMQETGGGNSTSREVLNKLKCDGDLDHLTHKILDRLKKNGELRNYIVSKVEQSFALNKSGAEIMNTRQLYDAILDEIKNPVLEKISEAAWKLLDSEDELGKEINEICECAYLQICDRKHKAPPSPEVSSSNSLNSFDWELIEPPG